MTIEKSTDETLEKIISSDIPVLIKFQANWCQPCKNLTLVVEEISKEMKGQVKFYYHDIESDPDGPVRYGPVMGIPHMIIFKNKEIVAQRTGSIPKAPLVAWIKENI